MNFLFRGFVGILVTLGLLGVAVSANAYGPPQPPRIFLVPPEPPAIQSGMTAPSDASGAIPTPEIIPQPDLRKSRLFLPLLATESALSLQRNEEAFSENNPLQDRFVYTIKPGDTLQDLAIEFGRDQKSLACARSEKGEQITRLLPGEKIVIPAANDLCHIVKKGETLTKIAAWYGVDEQEIVDEPLNHFALNMHLRPGQTLIIPNARNRYRSPDEVGAPRPRRDGWWYGDGTFSWPVPRESVWISQRFKHGKHMAIDLAAPMGTPVFAADTGKVVKAGWSDIGYGYRIVIDHGNDYVTLYAHLSEYYVGVGDIVEEGELIGRIGSTGNSTGPHLHFEIRDYGYLIDPLLVLKK